MSLNETDANQWHRADFRVYFEDTDAQGVVYFANYLKFMERARTEWLREQGLEQDRLAAQHRLIFSIVETHNRFHRPARFNDRLVVLTRVIEKGRARFSLDQEIRRNESDGETLCVGRCVAACLDADSFRPRRLPAGLLSNA